MFFSYVADYFPDMRGKLVKSGIRNKIFHEYHWKCGLPERAGNENIALKIRYFEIEISGMPHSTCPFAWNLSLEKD